LQTTKEGEIIAKIGAQSKQGRRACALRDNEKNSGLAAQGGKTAAERGAFRLVLRYAAKTVRLLELWKRGTDYRCACRLGDHGVMV
jgi:hypothetical protein